MKFGVIIYVLKYIYYCLFFNLYRIIKILLK